MSNTLRDLCALRKGVIFLPIEKTAFFGCYVISGIKLTTEQKIRHKTGNRYEIYINKKRIKEIKKIIEERSEEYKNGGIFPFLIPLLAGLGAVGSLAGGAAGIAKTVMTSKAKEKELEEQKRNNLELEKLARGDGMYINPWKSYGMSLDVKDFINNSKLDDSGKKSLRNIIKNLSDNFKIETKGNGLFLSPYSK